MVSNQDNGLFRHIRDITGYKDEYNYYVIFVDCKGYKNSKEELEYMLRNGFSVNGSKYIMFGKSASMSRNGIVGFIMEDVYDEMNKRAMMDIDIKTTVISKFEAYKNLLFSSCFFIEDYIPNIVIVDDYENNLPNQYIKYVVDKEIEYTDKKTGEIKSYIGKEIEEGYSDVSITPADGSGMHDIALSEKWARAIGIDYVPNVFMIRMPYIKGLSIGVDFKSFYKEHGIEYITDIWGKKHRIEDIDCIWTKSLYKGYKYFKTYGDYRDWEIYLEKFKKYNHAMGIAKWNFRTIDEPIYTRVNYQYLQTLNISPKEMISLADYTKQWIENILDGDAIYAYNFLGMGKDFINPSNKYMKAVSLHGDMLKDQKIRDYMTTLLKKYISEMKMGKLWIKGCFKIVIPDLVMLMQYAGGMEVVGCLGKDEFYAYGLDNKEYLIDRNPHICRSEHAVLTNKRNEYVEKYCGHLENVCMLNGYDITMKRLNGCDTDGDLVFVTDNDVMLKGVIRGLPIVIDIDDKITALDIPYDSENIINYVLMSLDSRIGEISNVATCYLNKQTKKPEQIKRYDDYVCLLSVVNGKEIIAVSF
jgi:hypothetical protein